MEFIGLFKCNFCSSNLHDIESLITHFSIQHLNKELFECEACCIKFWKIPDYYEHRNKKNSTCGGKYGITMKSFFHTIKSFFENLPKIEDAPVESAAGTTNDIKSEIELNEELLSDINISSKISEIPNDIKSVGKSEEVGVTSSKNEDISAHSEIENSVVDDKFEHDSISSSISYENYRSKLRNSKNLEKHSSKRKPRKKKSKKKNIKIFNEKPEKEVNKIVKTNEETGKQFDKLIKNEDCNDAKNNTLEKCKICDKSFNNADELRRHLANHGNRRNEMCVCHVCNKRLNSFSYLKIHISSKHPNNLFCMKCNKHFNDQESFDVHINEFHKINRNNNKTKTMEVKTLECFECIGKVFAKVSSFVMHLSNQHKKSDDEIKQILEFSNETFKNELLCKICGKLFVTIDHLMNHQEKKHGIDGKNRHKCKSCSEFFSSQEEVKSHILECHKEKLMCRICNKGKIYSCVDSLINHKRRIHKIYKSLQHPNVKQKSGNSNVDLMKKKVYKFVCGQCGKIMNGKTQFKNHEASNCGKNPVHKCNVCGKGFASAGILKGHVSIHEDYETYEFVCDFCHKRYRSKHQLTKHRRIHTGERPFQCPHCEKAFGTSAALFVHISTHTGVKRYMCTCGERFSCITGLKGHWKTNSTTCGSDPNKSTKAVGEYIGYRKGKVVNIRPEEEMMMRPSL